MQSSAPVPAAPAPDPGVPTTAFDQPAGPPAPAAQPMPMGPIPKSGSGLRAGGITMIVHGGLNLAVTGLSLALFSTLTGDEALPAELRGFLIGSALFYSAELGGGVAMTVIGSRRKRELQNWSMQNRVLVPKDGNGMIVVGSILAGLGTVNILSTVAVYSAYGQELPATSLVGAGINIAVGGGLLAGGLIRRSRYREWMMRNNLSMTPYAAPTRQGASFGIAGRF